ncbi:hypothetical protein M9H77_11464 [Catharanthus roseus]|uniref:Uncharacterized protein n=1 Tax=Catharanthus roseus TaxID=4058 RepID=A0ACC0BEP9_CATRO|nr:hypothetical protein M9H77_11464 [Catharanthus roseus]
MANCFFILFVTTIPVFISQSDGRYLRPSDHGLAYQNTSNLAKEYMPAEMLSFFNGGNKTTSVQSPSTPLPEARNLSSSDPGAATWWSKNRKSRDEKNGKNQVRTVLLVTSLVCGLTGVLLLVVSAFVFIYRYRKQRLEAEIAKQRSSSAPESSSAALALALPSVVNKKDSK